MSLQSIYDIIQGWKGKWGWRCENWTKFDNLEECWTKLIGNSYYFQKSYIFIMKFNVFIFIVRFAQYHNKSSKIIKIVIKIQVAKCLLVYNHCRWMPN